MHKRKFLALQGASSQRTGFRPPGTVRTGRTSGSVYYSSLAGTSFTRQKIAAGGHATNVAPAIAPLPTSRDPLVIAWTTPDGTIKYGTLGPAGFFTEGTQPQAGTNAAPALLYLGHGKAGTLYLAWKGKTTDKVFYSAVFDLPNSLAPGDWTAQEDGAQRAHEPGASPGRQRLRRAGGLAQ